MDETEMAMYRKRLAVNFGLFAAARATDPETSHQAATQNRPRRGTQAMRLLAMYAEHGPLTDEAAAHHAGIVGGWKRCSDLRLAGYIAPTGAVQETSMGAKANVCAMTDLGRHALTTEG